MCAPVTLFQPSKHNCLHHCVRHETLQGLKCFQKATDLPKHPTPALTVWPRSRAHLHTAYCTQMFAVQCCGGRSIRSTHHPATFIERTNRNQFIALITRLSSEILSGHNKFLCKQDSTEKIVLLKKGRTNCRNNFEKQQIVLELNNFKITTFLHRKHFKTLTLSLNQVTRYEFYLTLFINRYDLLAHLQPLQVMNTRATPSQVLSSPFPK